MWVREERRGKNITPLGIIGTSRNEFAVGKLTEELSAGKQKKNWWKIYGSIIEGKKKRIGK